MPLLATKLSAFNIDDSCKDHGFSSSAPNLNKIDEIISAAKEAANMAANAEKRASDVASGAFSNNPGTMMKDLFGDDSPEAYQSVASKSRSFFYSINALALYLVLSDCL